MLTLSVGVWHAHFDSAAMTSMGSRQIVLLSQSSELVQREEAASFDMEHCTGW